MVGTTACLLDFKTNKMTLENALQQETTKTLFKKDSSNRIRFITFAASNGELHQFSGLLDTDSPVCNTRVCKGKNIGKANATTAQEQAEKELISKYTRKQDSGYFPTIEEAKNNVVLLPMLAESYEKRTVQYPCFGQPKYDGLRMLCKKKGGTVTLLSRKNLVITTLKHIEEQMMNPAIPDGVYDGEAYSLELGSFQNQMKAIKKVGPTTHKVNFHIYDLVSDKPYSERLTILKTIFQ